MTQAEPRETGCTRDWQNRLLGKKSREALSRGPRIPRPVPLQAGRLSNSTPGEKPGARAAPKVQMRTEAQRSFALGPKARSRHRRSQILSQPGALPHSLAMNQQHLTTFSLNF